MAVHLLHKTFVLTVNGCTGRACSVFWWYAAVRTWFQPGPVVLLVLFALAYALPHTLAVLFGSCNSTFTVALDDVSGKEHEKRAKISVISKRRRKENEMKQKAASPLYSLLSR
jgi:hypothetical protein